MKEGCRGGGGQREDKGLRCLTRLIARVLDGGLGP
jgi:hypothetical protein